MFVGWRMLWSMVKTRNISLPPALDEFLQRRAKSGLYGNASAVIQAALRALHREEVGIAWQEWQAVKAGLPQDSISPESEQDIVAAVRKSRMAERRKASK